jgi:hypothetical protein
MGFKPFCRLCAACGLSLAVVVGEEHEHLHVETQVSPTFFQASNIVVATTSAAFIPLQYTPPRA